MLSYIIILKIVALVTWKEYFFVVEILHLFLCSRYIGISLVVIVSTIFKKSYIFQNQQLSGCLQIALQFLRRCFLYFFFSMLDLIPCCGPVLPPWITIQTNSNLHCLIIPHTSFSFLTK